MPQCPQDGSELKYVPAGTSRKTNKPYPAFYAPCEHCGYRLPDTASSLPSKPSTTIAKEEERDYWGNIGMAKAASQLYAACFEHGDSAVEAGNKVGLALQEIAKIQQNGINQPPFRS